MIYDCFIYFDELMLLEVRLKELDPVVDKFVLVEGTHTFTGKEKPLYYEEVKDSKALSPYKDKIIHVVHDETPWSSSQTNERSQRDYIAMGLKDAEPDDIIIVTDLDEIVDRRAVPLMEDYSCPTHLRMKFFYYFFNCRFDKDWDYPAFCRYRDFYSADILRLAEPEFIISNAGWHISYLFPVEQISRKLGSFSHTEYDSDYYRDTDRLQKCIDEVRDIFERPEVNLSIETLNAPACVMEDQEKYKEFIK